VNRQERALLLSIRPRFAESIMNGSKIAEIRRQRPNIAAGTPVIIYATLPVAAVVGSARLGEVHGGRPDEIWSDYQCFMGVTRAEFDEYLAGAEAAYVLMLADVQRLETPLALSRMREASDFHPPRSYRYINRASLSVLVDGHPSGDLLLSLLPSVQPYSAENRIKASSETAESSLFLSRRRRYSPPRPPHSRRAAALGGRPGAARRAGCHNARRRSDWHTHTSRRLKHILPHRFRCSDATRPALRVGLPPE
jgi:predicted transcriptional regulator